MDTADITNNISDTSGNGNTGFLKLGAGGSTATTTVVGPIKTSLSLDGTDDYVNIANNLTLTTYVSACAWIKITSGTSKTIVGKQDSGSGQRVFVLFVGSSGTAQFSSSPDGLNKAGNLVSSPQSVVDSRWHQICGVYDDTFNRIYVDGALKTSLDRSDDGIFSTTLATLIGAQNPSAVTAFFPGLIDDVRIYSRNLSAGDVTELYNLGYTPTLTTSAASSVTGTTATLNGSISIDNATASSTTRGFAYGTSATLATVIATTSESGTFGTGAFTADVSSLSGFTTYYFRAYASNATSTGYGSILSFTTDPVVTVPTVLTSAATSLSTTTLTLNGSITSTGGADATQSGFTYGTSPTLTTTIATTTLGSQTGTASFTGGITGLTPNTVYYFRAYAVNSAGTSTGAILSATTTDGSRWQFDEGSGTTASDSTGSGNTGTLTGSATWGEYINGNVYFLPTTASYVNIPSNSPGNTSLDATSTLTIAGWINLGSIPVSTSTIVSRYTLASATDNRGYHLSVDADRKLRLDLYNSNGTSNILTAHDWTPLNLDTWYYVAAVFTGTTTRFYLNGALTATSTAGTFTHMGVATTTALHIGDSTDHFVGFMDEVRVYTRILSATDISALYVADVANITHTPPVRSNIYPATSTLTSGITKTTLSLTTDTTSTCKYDTSADVAYASMAHTFSTTAGTAHYEHLTGLTSGTSYNYYIKCQDGGSEANSNDVHVAFAIPTGTPTAVSGSSNYYAAGGISYDPSNLPAGTLADPFPLAYALTGAGGAITAGKTVWLRGGLYSPGMATTSQWTVSFSGSAGNLVTWRSFTDEWAKIDRPWRFGASSYHRFRDLEFYDSHKIYEVGSTPNGVTLFSHFDNTGSVLGMEWINVVVHDVRTAWAGTTAGQTVRGSIIWNVGMNYAEHVVYPSVNVFEDNIVGWTAGQVIELGSPGIEVRSNIIFGGGQTVNYPARELLIAVSGTIDQNRIYTELASMSALYYNNDGTLTATITDNTFSGSTPVVLAGPFISGTFTGNILHVNKTGSVYNTLVKNHATGVWTINNNTYSAKSPRSVLFDNVSTGQTFAQWKVATGYDANSTATNSSLPADAVYVIPNQDESKRANIAIYNWSQTSTVSVDVSSVLSPGDTYTLYSAQNYLAGPIQTGTVSGSTITVPMTGLTAAPVLWGLSIPSTMYGTSLGVGMTQPSPMGSEFAAFVVVGATPDVVSVTPVPTSSSGSSSSGGSSRAWWWLFNSTATSTQLKSPEPPPIKQTQDKPKLKTLVTANSNGSEVTGVHIDIGSLASLLKRFAIATFTREDKNKLPSEVVFAKPANIPIYDVTDQGSIHVLQGKPIDLAIKTDKPVKEVVGYLTIKKIDRKTALLDLQNQKKTSQFAAVGASVEDKLVLETFKYTDTDGDGIYTATITAPKVHGEYDIMTILEYKDAKLGYRELHLTAVVDPEGYVYVKNSDGETRTEGSIVTLLWKNPTTSTFEIWPATDFKQTNPQTTDKTGNYSFLVPEGTYQLTVSASDYYDYTSPEFTVTQGAGVHENIELIKRHWWKTLWRWFTGLF